MDVIGVLLSGLSLGLALFALRRDRSTRARLDALERERSTRELELSLEHLNIVATTFTATMTSGADPVLLQTFDLQWTKAAGTVTGFLASANHESSTLREAINAVSMHLDQLRDANYVAPSTTQLSKAIMATVDPIAIIRAALHQRKNP